VGRISHCRIDISLFDRETAVEYLFSNKGDNRLRPGAEKSIAEKILWAHEDGSPVAPRDEAGAIEMASIARRRWNSFARRQKNIPNTTQARIEDLARGLAAKFTDGGWPMVGPLISDYRWLAEQIAPLLDVTGQSEINGSELPANE
jgi:hypothetical protein